MIETNTVQTIQRFVLFFFVFFPPHCLRSNKCVREWVSAFLFLFCTPSIKAYCRQSIDQRFEMHNLEKGELRKKKEVFLASNKRNQFCIMFPWWRKYFFYHHWIFQYVTQFISVPETIEKNVFINAASFYWIASVPKLMLLYLCNITSNI